MDIQDLNITANDNADENQQVEKVNKTKTTYGNETGVPPIVVVVQGGKGCGKQL